MKKALMIAALATSAAIGWFLNNPASSKNTAHAETPIVSYETPDFFVQYPSGAQIELRNEHDADTNSSTHYYRGRLPNHSWADVDIIDFPGAVLPEDHTEILFSKKTTALFTPGFSATPITKTILGGLQGYEQIIHGQMLSEEGLSLVIHWRLAIASNPKRVWILQTITPTDQDLPEAVCEEFFNSLKIK